MKKQYIILLAVVCALMASLMLAACSQPTSSSGSDEGSSSAVEQATSEATEAEATEAVAEADGEYTGLPAFQPVDHVGRTYEECPTCHDGSTAPAIPDDHFINGELDGSRLQCVTCHVVEPAA